MEATSIITGNIIVNYIFFTWTHTLTEVVLVVIYELLNLKITHVTVRGFVSPNELCFLSISVLFIVDGLFPQWSIFLMFLSSMTLMLASFQLILMILRQNISPISKVKIKFIVALPRFCRVQVGNICFISTF